MGSKIWLSAKSKLWLFPALLGMVSCSSSNDLMPEDFTQTVEYCDDTYRSSEEACSIASGLFASETSAGRSAESKRIKRAIPIYNSAGRSEDSKLLYYAVDYENDGGFAIIAAPKSVAPVIAVIDEGSFEDPENLNNIPYQHTLLSISEYITRKSLSPEAVITPIEKNIYDTLDVDRKNGPNVSVAWGQAWPENRYTPNGVAGCAPIAVAQVLSSFELPKSMYFNNTSMPASTEVLNWTDMKKHSRSTLRHVPAPSEIDDRISSCECKNHDQIGKVVRQLGEDMDANYIKGKDGKESSTPVADTNVLPCLKKYLNNKTSTSITNVSSLQSSLLKDNTVAIINGTVTKKNLNTGKEETYGHTWVADGAWTVGRRIMVYWRDPDVTSPTHGMWVWSEWRNTIVELIHYNWGWGGNCNGYFKKDVFDPTNKYASDFESENNTGYTKFTVARAYLIE